METTRDIVRAFIAENFFVADPEILVDDLSLVDEGIVDSTGVLEVVAFLEEEFDIEVEDAELVPENLESIGRIVRFLARKSSQAA